MNQQPDEEPARCRSCGNVYRDQRWHDPDYLENIDGPDMGVTLCVGCKKVLDGAYSGVLNLKGNFLPKHVKELANKIKNRVKQVQKRNPLSKIVEVEKVDQSEIQVRITTAQLAEHLGRSIKQAYNGELSVQESDNVIHASWEREDL